MVNQKIVVKNPSGIHARPASVFVGAAGKFKSKITILKGDNRINGKSIISVLSGAITCGSEIDLVVEGPDENEALTSLIALIESGLGE